MKRRVVLVSMVSAISMLLVPIAPASAAGAGAIVFVGKAHLTKAICYPVAFCNPGAATYTFAASTKKPDPHGGPSDCVGVEVSSKKAGIVSGPRCDINAAGAVNPGPLFSPNGPHCGDSSGTSAGTIRFYLDQAAKNSVSFTGGWPISIGGSLPIIGTATKGTQSGPAVVIVNAAPDLIFKGDSCSTGADDFRVVGVGAAVTL